MRMLKKAGGVLMLCLAVFMAAVTVKGLSTEGRIRDTIEEAVWLESGSCDPANEGRVVTVMLDPAAMGNAVDPDLGLTFEAPVVRRHVHRFRRVNTDWEWHDVPGYSEDTLRYKCFSGGTTGGMLDLDPQFAQMFPTGRMVRMEDLTDESAAKAEAEWDIYVDQERTYLTNASPRAFSDDLEGYELYEDEGAVRIYYEMSPADVQSAAMTGIQQGNTLVWDEDISVVCSAQGVSSREELLKNCIQTLRGGAALFSAGILLVVYFGLKWLGVIRVGVLERIRARRKTGA